MAKDIWVISDTHFSHENILKFTDSNTGKPVRGHLFDNIDQMDEYMLEKWNSVVKQGDIVYHLGDVFMGCRERFAKQWPKFNGSKRLVVGNHDDIKFLSSGGFFKKVYESRIFSEFNLILTHRPAHDSQMYRMKQRGLAWVPENLTPMRNIHGHIHQNPSPEGPYRNMSVEAIDYTPVNIEELRFDK